MTNVRMETSIENKPFDLILGDGCFYVNKQTGLEIRLCSYRKGGDSDPANARLGYTDKYGKQGFLSLNQLFEEYRQEQKPDFDDPVDPKLPYIFDLFFDVKTISGLKQHIEWYGMDDYLKKMMIDHNISLSH